MRAAGGRGRERAGEPEPPQGVGGLAVSTQGLEDDEPGERRRGEEERGGGRLEGRRCVCVWKGVCGGGALFVGEWGVRRGGQKMGLGKLGLLAHATRWCGERGRACQFCVHARGMGNWHIARHSLHDLIFFLDLASAMTRTSSKSRWSVYKVGFEPRKEAELYSHF